MANNTIVSTSDQLIYNGIGPVDAKSAPVTTVDKLPSPLWAYEGLEVVVKKDPETGTFAKYWFKNSKWEREPMGDDTALAELSASTVLLVNDLDELSGLTADLSGSTVLINSGLTELSAYTASLKTSGSIELIDHVVDEGFQHYYYIPEIDLNENSTFTIKGLPARTKVYYNHSGQKILFTYERYEYAASSCDEDDFASPSPQIVVVYNYDEATKKATYHNYFTRDFGIPKYIIALLSGNALERRWQMKEKKQRKNGDKKLDVLPSYSTMQRPYVYIGQTVLISRYTRFHWDSQYVHYNNWCNYFYLEKYYNINFNKDSRTVKLTINEAEYNAIENWSEFVDGGHLVFKYNGSYNQFATSDGEKANLRIISTNDWVMRSNGEYYDYTFTLTEDAANNFNITKAHIFMPVRNDFFAGCVIKNKNKDISRHLNYLRSEDMIENYYRGEIFNPSVHVLKRCEPKEYILVARDKMMINPLSADRDGMSTSENYIDTYGYYSNDNGIIRPYELPHPLTLANLKLIFNELVRISVNPQYEVLYYVAGGNKTTRGGYKWRRLNFNHYGNPREQNFMGSATANYSYFRQYLSDILTGKYSRGKRIAPTDEHCYRYLYVAVFRTTARPHRNRRSGTGRSGHPYKIGTLYKISYTASTSEQSKHKYSDKVLWEDNINDKQNTILSIRRKGTINYPNKLR